MRFPDSFLDEIRERIPISEVVGKRVSFDRKKTNRAKGDFWACCPFHGEKTPSFHCEDRKGRYHCFGCGVSGDHFRFLTELDGMSFPEAVQMLADHTGLPMPTVSPREREAEEKRRTLYDVMEMATAFFHDQLQTASGAKARAYLRERGISSTAQATFRLGYAPSDRNALKSFLASRDVTAEQMVAAGLVVSGEGVAVSYDRFRDRVIFPIPDSRGRIIAFGGRALSPDIPAKYLNSPETELFHKSNVLYNYAEARRHISGNELIVAEGNMDVIALHMAGFKNAVAPLGTALTERQMLLLWRVCSEPLLCFDGDEAGLKAAYRSIDMLLPGLEPGRSARFVMLPEGLDPDDLIARDGPQAMESVLQAALPLSEMIWNRETASGVFDTPERRAALEANIRSVTSLIKNENVRRHYEQDMWERLAAWFGGGTERGSRRGGDRNGAWFDYPGSKKRAGPPGTGAARAAPSPSLLNSSLMKRAAGAPSLREACLIMAVVNHPAILNLYFEEFVDLPLTSAVAEALRSRIVDHFAADSSEAQPEQGLSAQALRQALSDGGQGEAIARMDRQLAENRIWQFGIEAAFEDSLEGWRQAYSLHIRQKSLKQELRAAECAFAEDSSEENLQRLLEIQAELSRVDGTEALIEGFGVSSGRPLKRF